MNRSGGVMAFEVESRSPPLSYAYRYPIIFWDFESG